MLGNSVLNLKSLVNVVVVALAALIALPTHATAPNGAQLISVGVGGDLTSGGQVFYRISLDVTSPGDLKATASIQGRRWRTTKFSVLASSVDSLGIQSFISAPVSIPTNFVGNAKLRVKVTYDKKRIGSKTVLVTINASPPSPTAAPPTTLYDVGFGTSVLLTNVASTNGLTPPLTYSWKITDTDVRTNATISNASSNIARLTTLSVTNFIPVAGGVGLIPVDNDEMTRSTYHLKVTVTDTVLINIGTLTVTSASMSPGQPYLPLGEKQYFSQLSDDTNSVPTYSWSLLGGPSGSTATLGANTTAFTWLQPDREGDYTIQSTVILSNISTSVRTTNVSTFVVTGAKYEGIATCASCHGPFPQVGLTDMVTPWSQTGHATMAQRGVDGLLSPSYNESCFVCHTLGYNQAPLAASNGNFYAVEKQLGWTFPTVLQTGNYATMPTNLQNLANIQCESCHGPGSQHPSQSTSLNGAVCASCHEDGSHHVKPQQWELSPHDVAYEALSESEGTSATCARCHAPMGFVDRLKGKNPIRTGTGNLSCQTCHDPHVNPAAGAHQLRVYDTVTLDDSVAPTPPTLTGQGTSATCMSCHNARRSPPPTYSSSTTLPHDSTATDVLLAIRASTNVMAIVSGAMNVIATVTLENSAHHTVAKCVDCHMFQGSNTVGDHTFSMTDRLTDADNVAACNQCHAGVDPVTDFDHVSVLTSGRPHGGDYDGSGITEGVQTEVDGVLTNLVTKMLATGITRGSGGSAWTSLTNSASYPVIYAAQRNAVWNEFLIERELSRGVHNTRFAVGLLQWSYTVLSTNTGGRAYSDDFPNADILYR
ncbi:MAG: hypothetical protein ABSH21_07270 [Verrucomicrobiia bacterium]|jgi:hypothetical protein